uniref:Uncharacterized protein n=1 Tax=Mus spicilegus TaxID=10103 RepID=A0A8C6IBB5_MUSSI
MLVVLLTAALLALSSAQSTDEGTKEYRQSQDSQLDPSSADGNTENIQGGESGPVANEGPSANSVNEQKQQPLQESQQAEGQEPSDSAGKKEENKPGENNVDEDKNQLLSITEISQGQPKQINPEKKPSMILPWSL